MCKLLPVISVILFATAAPTVRATPSISEFMASNATSIADEDGDQSDWIEITNSGAAAIDLDGYYLTDSVGNLTKWDFPQLSIAPGAAVIVFASDKNRDEGELHTNFKLSAGGEYLALVAPDGTTVLSEFAPEYPPLGQDISFGINPAGSSVFFNNPTPGTANGAGDSIFVEAPVFSADSQLFVGSLSLSITSPDATGTIHHTTDGSVPTAASPVFSAPISITGSTTVKAITVLPGGASSRIVTNHFARVSSDLATFDSNLPITVVDADSAVTNFSDAGEPAHEARVFIIPTDEVTGRATITDPAQVITRAGTNIRGNTSAGKEKANYNMEFWNGVEQDLTHGSTGENLPQDKDEKVLGMPSESDWVLYGLDLVHERSYFNNAFVYGLARDIDHPAPRTRYCEMFLNPGGSSINLADYRGIYMWVEKIKTANGRIELGKFDSTETDPAELGGYIFRSNDVSPGDLTFRTDAPFNTPTYNGNSFSIFDPNTFDANHPGRNTTANATAASRDRIQEFVTDFEVALFSNNFGDPDIGYANYIDPRTFMVWHSLQELAANNDIYHASAYFQKSVGGRLEAGSLWDFDWAFTRPHSVSPGGANAYLGWWYLSNDYRPGLREDSLAPWFIRLAEHSEYSDEWHGFWADLRRGLLSDTAIDTRLDGLAAELTEAAVRDQNKFGGLGMTQQVSEMKSWIKGRASWMDSQLGGLPPTFSLAAGVTPAGSSVTINRGSGQAGTIYYTTDGSDPRLAPSSTPGSTVVLLPREDLWEYLDDGSNAGTAWRNTTGGWSTGQAELGYGDNSAGQPTENTVVQSGPSGNRHITTYFRKSINIPNVNDYTSMEIRLRRDDGAVVYVNGTEVLRDNMPAAPTAITHLTPASASQSGSDESTFFDFPIPISEFNSGTNIIAVEIHQSGGSSSDISFDLELAASSGGASPQISGSALTSPNPILLTGLVEITARSFDGTDWSPLSRATYIPGGQLAAAGNLIVSEISYNPPEADPASGEEDVDNDKFEFIELLNTNGSTIDLSGISFAQGIGFEIADDEITPLAPGERAVLVEDRSAFASRHGDGIRVIGKYDGALSNSGEPVELLAADGSVIESISFSDRGTWPDRPDRVGSTLVRQATPGSGDTPGDWYASVEYGGTPGGIGDATDERIVVNEALANSLPPVTDTIEFFNTTGTAIDISGWYVSDGVNLRKYQFPTATTIAAGGFLVIDESDFNPGAGTAPTDFALNSVDGDVVRLVQAGAGGLLERFVTESFIPPSATNQSLGLAPDGIGELIPFFNTSLGISNTVSYEGWAAVRFGALTPASERLPSADPDNDDINNLLEFVLGLDPTITSPNPITIELAGDDIQITYQRRVPITGYELRLSMSPDLVSWDNTPAGLIPDPNPTAIAPTIELVTDSVSNLTTASRLFFRIEVVLP